jgi:hypothetical protein
MKLLLLCPTHLITAPILSRWFRRRQIARLLSGAGAAKLLARFDGKGSCRHEVVMNVDHLPGDLLTVPSFGPRVVVHKVWDHRHRCEAKLEREGEAMKRPSGGKQPPQPALAGKPQTWSIYHLKGTPAAFLGHVEAPDEESAIRKAIKEFEISPALQNRLLAQRLA